MKKLSDTAQIGIAIVGLALAYATFAKPGEGGTGGGGGGLDVPFIPDLSSFSPASIPSDVVDGQPVISGASLRSFFETSLQLTPDTFVATGKKTYSGQRSAGDSTYYVEGNLDIAGNQLNELTGQLFTDLGGGEKLYSEKSTTDIPKKAVSTAAVNMDALYSAMGRTSAGEGGLGGYTPAGLAWYYEMKKIDPTTRPAGG